ncbi:hypothetical protein MBLNU230_g7293t1 [Neophaeotheca triangularis]
MQGPSSDLDADNAAIRARLRRLENAVFNNNRSGKSSFTDSPEQLNGPITTSKPNARLPAPESEVVKTFTGDLQFLEGVGTRENTRMPNMSYGLRVGTEHLANLHAMVACGTLSYGQLILPTETEALHLFASYSETVDTLQHIVHVPSIHVKIADIFERLRNNEPTNVNQLMLLFSILATTAVYKSFSTYELPSILGSSDEATAIGMYWLRCALDVHTHSQRTTSPSLEIIQGTIIVMFLIFHIEGFSPKAFYLHATALTNARHMGLHITDSVPLPCSQPQTRDQMVETEVKRRVWWHLAATDWSLALVPGPQECTYSVQRRHIRVNMPRNVSDEDLMTRGAEFDRPLSEPTVMSYYLSRVRLGELCREAADATWDYFACDDISQMPYDRVTELDGKFSQLLETLPGSLTLNGNRSCSDSQLVTGDQIIDSQRYFTNLTILTRRCRLHLPFLIRASQDPRFAFSRTVCLESARKVLSLRARVTNDLGPQRSNPLKLVCVLHHLFCAVIVLVLDMCVHGDKDGDEERKSEVHSACEMLVEAGKGSLHAGMYLESLTIVLKKHKVKLQGSETSFEQSRAAASTNASEGIALTNQAYAAGETATDGLFSGQYPNLFEDYLDLSTTTEVQDWDALFRDLDNQAYQ